MSDRLPETWATRGALDSEDEDAAELVQGALQPVDPPHPATGERIRNRIVERLTVGKPARTRRLVLVLAAIAAAVVVVTLALPSPDRPSRPEPSRLLRGVAALNGQRIAPGSAVEHDATLACDSGCEVAVSDHVRAVLETATALRVTNDERVVLERGRADFHVQPSLQGFSVTAGDTVVEVVGTVFTVEMSDDGAVAVVVTSGVVRMRWPGGERLLSASDSWSPAEPEPESVEDPELRAPPAKPPQLTAGEYLRRATRALAEGDLNGARHAYRQLALRNDASGELGLYLLAQLELQRAERPEVARDLLERMSERFPGGAMARERELLRIEALVEMQECSAASSAADAFAERFPRARAQQGELRARIEACQ